MTVFVDLRNLFDLFCIVQGVSTITWLLLQPNQRANRWLALLLLGLTLQVVDYFLSRSGIYYHHRWLYFTPLFFSLGFGPLLYGYVQARLAGPIALCWYHFIPVIIQALFYALLTGQSLDTKAWFWQTVHKPYSRHVEYYAGCLLMLYYLYRSGQLLRQTGSHNGLTNVLKGAALFYVIALIDPLINSVYLSPQDPKFFLTAQVLPFLVCSTALIGRGYGHVLARVRGQSVTMVRADHQELVLRAIRETRVYQNPELTLSSLAQQLGLSPGVLSRTINSGFGQSFTDFINGHRIDEVKRRLEAGDDNRVTILALALEAGFASKTTFNRVFKEQTGLNPKAYKKRCQSIFRDDEAG